MKKITLLSVALVAIAFASCKKDYTCTCTSIFFVSSKSFLGGRPPQGADARCLPCGFSGLDQAVRYFGIHAFVFRVSFPQ